MPIHLKRLSGGFYTAAVTSLLLVAYIFASERITSRMVHSTGVGIHLPISISAVFPSATSTTGVPGNPTSKSTAPSSAALQVSGDVPESTVQRVATAVGKVPGLNELVVMRSVSGSGYSVSATVDLGENATAKSDVWASAVQGDVSRYFEGLYSSSLDVQNAEVYFTLGGNIVAGAGLGRTAYENMVSNVSTNPASIAQAIAELPVVSQDGANDSWFEQQATTPSQP